MKNISPDISNLRVRTADWYVPVTLVLSLVYGLAMGAEQSTDVQSSPAQLVNDSPIEEITVVAEPSTIFLLEEIKNAEVMMYDIFNDLNSTDDFDVICRNITYTSTLIPTWECDAGFMTRERFQGAQDYLQFGFIQKTDEELYWENRDRVEALNAEMLSLAKENPGLAEVMLDLNAKKQRLEEIESGKRESTKGFFSRLLGREVD